MRRINVKTVMWQLTGAGDPTRRGEPLFGIAMIFPAVCGLALFQFLPMLSAAVSSVRRFNPFTKRATGWAGIDNFSAVLSDPSFHSAMLVTVAYVILSLLLMLPLSLGLAMLLDRRVPGTFLARAAVLGALAASESVSALIWNQMYLPNNGLFSAILNAIGLSGQPFLTSAWQSIPSIIAISAWKDIGLPMLIFLGGLQAIPPHLYEAAAIDGASPWPTFRRITLPMLQPSLILASFMITVGAVRLFTPIYLLTEGGPNGATTNIAYYAYVQNFHFSSPGHASASVIVMLIVLALIGGAQVVLLRSKKRIAP
ncbi:sugar ABC transporter permease [Rhizobium sp. S152]|uniref:carbohydrate ABC transporter permease n=1 Tax=Rhizobium sp. S152 TaxID=3055038 RepID=UPI0025AA2DBE|nr:sugar ABC transporter permease [Rhizobium sp. S152]MDM9624684.1 sugar ABC transporter permease [Rhizobium sp. S152]